MFAIIGTIVHSISLGNVEVIEKGMMIYDTNGCIREVVDLAKTKVDMTKFEQIQDFSGKLIVPGFVDAHCHAPQYVFTGTGMDLPLLEWLEKYTFPCEAKFSDSDFAKIAYEKSIRRHLKCGTTLASYFATIHNEAGKILVDVINQVGQRAFVGKVSMDRNAPDFYKEDTKVGCDDAEEFIRYVLSMTETGSKFVKSIDGPYNIQETTVTSVKRPRTVSLDTMEEFVPSNAFSVPQTEEVSDDWIPFSKKARSVSIASDLNETVSTFPPAQKAPPSCSSNFKSLPSRNEGSLMNRSDTPLVMPCVTPRFVPTCTPQMMARLGELSSKYKLPVQSHMSESLNEILWVADLHPDCNTYASVYEKYGLLHSNVYMAHCCHSGTEERALLAKTGTSVVHCASSNFMLSSGVMDVRLFLQEGIKVALGTDVAGGFSPSMLDALRQTVVASRVRGFHSHSTLHSKERVEKKGEGDSIDSTDSSGSDSLEEVGLVAPVPGVASEDSLVSDEVEEQPMVEEKYKTLNFLEAFHLATVGGAEVLGMGDVVGNFIPGKKLDCLVVDVASVDSPIDVFEGETPFDHFQKFLFLGDDRNIHNVFVDGKKVL